MIEQEWVAHSKLTEQVDFLSSYGFEITYDYVQMLLAQIAIRDAMIVESQRDLEKVVRRD